MFGSHLSIAGSMVNALDEAQALGLDTVQVFTKNQQQWKAKPLDPDLVKQWRAKVAELGWAGRLVCHASYLINLASPDDTLWDKSIVLMADEIERCHALGITYLVHHPGAYTTSIAAAGLARIASAYQRLGKLTRACTGVISCLENTVGSGSNLGADFAQLGELRDLILAPGGGGWPAERLGVCIDTCHAHAAGYVLDSAESARSCLAAIERDVGARWIRVWHINNSKAPAGSRLDRHEHIDPGTGAGTIHLDAFRVIVNSSLAADKPKIMETPKGSSPAGVSLDTLNLRCLRGLLESPGNVPHQRRTEG
jgi:deoxyribonuclease IV